MEKNDLKKEYIVLEKLLESLPDFNLTSFLEENKNKKLIIAKNVLYFEKEDLEKFYSKKLELNFFKLKGMPNDFKIVKFKDLDLTKENIYKNAKEYNKEFNNINRINKIIHSNNKSIKCFDLLKHSLDNNNILCFDVEAYEHDQSKLTEIGFTFIDNSNQKIINKHFIIKENEELRNGIYVEDNKDNYLFGESQKLNLKESINELKNILKKTNIVIGQGIKNDFKYINKIDQNFFSNHYKIIDTEYICRLLNPSGLSLKKALDSVKIDYKYLHNAGNDAYFNTKFALYMVKFFDIEKFKKDNEVLKNNHNLDLDEFKSKWNNKEIELNDLTLN